MRYLFICLLLTWFVGCKKNSEPAIVISGFVVTDPFGQIITSIGTTDDDWKTGPLSSLPGKEQEIILNNDSLPSLQTVMSDIHITPAYPNPASYQSNFSCSSNDSVALHMFIVDEKGSIFYKYTKTFKGNTTVSFDFSDRSKFPSGKSLRCIYSFSAAGHQNFKAGHGDIKVCDNPNINSCF